MAEEGGHAVSAHPDPDDLALAALPAEPSDPGVAAHLAGCATCRAHVDELARTVALAQDGGGAGDLGGPPDRVWAAITAELGAEIQPVDDAPPPERPKARRRVLVAAVAALVALVAGVGIGLGVGAVGGAPGAGPPSSTVVAQLQPIGPLDPAASGTLTATERAGVRTMAVRLTRVPDTAGADYLEVWLMNGAGTEIVALGALTRDDTGYTGSFTVPSNLPMAQLDLVDVSAERYDGNPGHSGVSILRGTLA
jgi:Anti-sigma-K factor rskA, C-terminal